MPFLNENCDGIDFKDFGQDIFGFFIPPMPTEKPLPKTVTGSYDERLRFLQQEKRKNPSF